MGTLKSESLTDSRRLAFLDGLKGISILYVSFGHVGHRAPSQIYFPGCFYGVQLFFIISAFSIMSSWKNSIEQNPHPVKTYFIRRVLRIWPLWWIFIFLFAIFFGASLKAILLNMTFLFGFYTTKENYELVGGGWSLFVEEIFYFLFPFLFAYKINNWSKALFACLVFIGVSLLWEGWFVKMFEFSSDTNFVYRHPLHQFFCFFLGLTIYYLKEKTNYFMQLSSYIIWLLDFLTVGLVFYCLTINLQVSALALGLLFFISMIPKSFLHKFMGNRYLVWAGRRCYSLYLLQFLVINFFEPILKKFFLLNENMFSKNLQNIIWFLICFLCYFALAEFFYRFIERPCVALSYRYRPGV